MIERAIQTVVAEQVAAMDLPVQMVDPKEISSTPGLGGFGNLLEEFSNHTPGMVARSEF